jgi:hypothetical protein
VFNTKIIIVPGFSLQYAHSFILTIMSRTSRFFRKIVGLIDVRLLYIHGISRGEVNILGGHRIGHSKQKNCICTCVLFRTDPEIELFHCTVPKLLRRQILRTVSNAGDKVGTVYLI